MRAGTTSAPQTSDDEPSNVRTFSVPDSDEDEYDPNY
jgi:hypothetical protein